MTRSDERQHDAPALHGPPLRAACRLVVACVLLLAATGCTYLSHVSRQSRLAEDHRRDPSLVTLKHLLEHETYFVYGRLLDPDDVARGRPLAVAACADAYGTVELVDVMHRAVAGTHYGLHLPRVDGQGFRLVVLMDADGDGTYGQHEVFGERTIDPGQLASEERVAAEVTLELGARPCAEIPAPVRVLAASADALPTSLFYPGGSIRSLDDPIFDRDMATLGMYEPAAFSERAPTMFYALEEDRSGKIPVVFVHGINGSARDFEAIVGALDRRRFKPWFFHYPSGVALEQTARLFHGIFLSGDAVGVDPRIPMVIVAHSMGGLVVREALNLLEADGPGSAVHLVTIASPLGGHPAAATGENSGLLVVPSWRSLNPASDFIAQLYRRPLGDRIDYTMLFAYHDDSLVRFGENSDGVVPLSSQLRADAQQEAHRVRGFDATHVGVLSDPAAIAFLLDDVHRQETTLPSDHQELLLAGGYEVPDGAGFGPHSRHMIETMGLYVRALADGRIAPLDDEQRHFVEVANGRAAPHNELERGWLDFVARWPEPVRLREDGR